MSDREATRIMGAPHSNVPQLGELGWPPNSNAATARRRTPSSRRSRLARRRRRIAGPGRNSAGPAPSISPAASCRLLAGGLALRLAPRRLARRDVVEVEIVRGPRLDLRHVGIEHADARLGAGPRAVPDGAVARDLHLRLVRDLRRRVIAEFAGLRVEHDGGAALAVVAEPDVALQVGLRVVGPRQVERPLELGRLAALRIHVADDAAVVDAVPDAVLEVDAGAADPSRLSDSFIFRESVRHRVVLADPRVAAEQRHPDVALAVDVDAVRRGRPRRRGEHRDLARLPVPLVEAVAADHRHPDVALRVDHRRVRLQALLDLSFRVQREHLPLPGPWVEPAQLHALP